ncbi:BgTH12-00649 [Blumeria graminis f. sp. triticale]|uniref:Bgt-3104 n=3 Tax=Blumeria graminis TaxID=34373 RepID=A0A381L6Q4_BLUGR|nr:hypothetical protein BGT96224_3104 [Blumeria graminis f. sp. tritici 96224]CAD6505154.1 BgTH12-00649 [Blumeria graminis f. sp. triticale]VDB93156.1 Bgt-3104 [Blumeria graminis f. sp. tritici]
MTLKEQDKLKLPAKRKHHQVAQDEPVAAILSSSSLSSNPVKKPRLNATLSDLSHQSVATANQATPSAVPSKPDSAPLGPLSLDKNYELHNFSVLSSSKICTRVTQILAILSSPLAAQGSKNKVVLLHAKPNAAGKLISIVEILKREISGSTSDQWFQYNELDKALTEDTTSRPKKSIPDVEKDTTNNSENKEGIHFEVMKTPYERSIESIPKIRTDLTLRIYLSRVRIESLKKICG